MVTGNHELLLALPPSVRQIARSHLHWFAKESNRLQNGQFDLRGASVGNLILTGGFLANQRDINTVIYMFSKLLRALGTVRPTSSYNLHLRAHHESGETTTGQHNIGKTQSIQRGKIVSLELVQELRGAVQHDTSLHSESLAHSGSSPEMPLVRHFNAVADAEVPSLISSAHIIVYPPGSFWSSVIANLLVQGVGRAIVGRDCPKVYVPNAGPCKFFSLYTKQRRHWPNF